MEGRDSSACATWDAEAALARLDARLEALAPLLEDAEALILRPPFADTRLPCLGAHLLQACSAQSGLRTAVLYTDLAMAALVGENRYHTLCFHTNLGALIGERFFAAAAYGGPAFGRDPDAFWDGYAELCRAHPAFLLHPDELRELEPMAAAWADRIAALVARRRYRVVGCTSMFEQTSASVSLLNRIKALCPDVVTILGGANCEGEMAEGILSLGSAIDYVFSGESEVTYPTFLRRVVAGDLPTTRILYGEPCWEMDSIPRPRYQEFFAQREALLPGSEVADNWIPYETSRGCWWGQKQHCTFCGLNGATMKYREKSPDRVVLDIRALVEECPSRRVAMADNIMPFTYFRTLVPRLAEELRDVTLFYEQKANLTLDRVIALKAAGITQIQPGIEALSSRLLKRMRKGVSGAQNLALMRYARSVGVSVTWNLLYGFPGDGLPEYEETLLLLPLVRHLEPPEGLGRIRVQRFSPYFDHAAEHGVTNLRPIPAYAETFPAGSDCGKLAYTFDADYPSESLAHETLAAELEAEIERWRESWMRPEAERPYLWIHQLRPGTFMLVDTRGIPGTQESRLLDRRQAGLILSGGRGRRSPETAWALENQLLAEMDGQYVPLATAHPEVLLQFETALPVLEAAPPRRNPETVCQPVS